MGGPLGQGGVMPNIKDGTNAQMKSPTPGPAVPAVSKYDVICQRVFGCDDYDNYLHTSLTATAFLGRQVASIHQEVVNTLRTAESAAVAARGSSYKAPSVSSTLRRKKAMHAFGMAIDFDILDNPYILDESGESKLDQQLVVAYNHIAQFMLGKNESDIPKIRKGRSAFGDGSVGAVYDALKEESDAMKQYFAMMKDSSQLNDFLTKTWPSKHPGQTAPSASEIQSQMQTDYETLGGTNASGKKTPSQNGDRPFAPSSSGGRGDPATGFLNMDKDFVLAMTRAGFAWGAIDFGPASGDVQHFDTRTLKFGRQAYNGLLGRFPSTGKT